MVTEPVPKKDKLDQAIMALESGRKKIGDLMEKASAFLDRKREVHEESKVDALLTTFEKQGENQRRIMAADDISPLSKEVMLRAVKKRRVDISHAVKKLTIEEEANENSSNEDQT